MQPLCERFGNALPIGIISICNTGCLAVLELDEREEKVVAALSYGHGYDAIRHHRIHYTSSGRPYFNKHGIKFYLDEIMRCNYAD